MTPAEKISRLETLLARVIERKSQPRPARAPHVAPALAATPATSAAAVPPATAAPQPQAPPPAASATPAPAPAPTRSSALPPAPAKPPTGLPPAPRSPLAAPPRAAARDSDPGGEFVLPTMRPAAMSPPPSATASIELTDTIEEPLEIDRAPLATVVSETASTRAETKTPAAATTPPPSASAAAPAGAARIEPSALPSADVARVIPFPAPSGPQSFRSLLQCALTLRVKS